MMSVHFQHFLTLASVILSVDFYPVSDLFPSAWLVLVVCDNINFTSICHEKRVLRAAVLLFTLDPEDFLDFSSFREAANSYKSRLVFTASRLSR